MLASVVPTRKLYKKLYILEIATGDYGYVLLSIKLSGGNKTKLS